MTIRDKVWFDTAWLSPGKESRFLTMGDRIGQLDLTNMVIVGQFSGKGSDIRSIGVRLPGRSKAEEDALLDHMLVYFSINDKRCWESPAAVCSTKEYRGLDDIEPAPEKALPGYVFEKTLHVPERAYVHAEIYATRKLPIATEAQVLFFCRQKVDVV